MKLVPRTHWTDWSHLAHLARAAALFCAKARLFAMRNIPALSERENFPENWRSGHEKIGLTIIAGRQIQVL